MRVHLAGICLTDVESTRGHLGLHGTPGHEWVGHVEAADDAEILSPGGLLAALAFAAHRGPLRR